MDDNFATFLSGSGALSSLPEDPVGGGGVVKGVRLVCSWELDPFGSFNCFDSPGIWNYTSGERIFSLLVSSVTITQKESSESMKSCHARSPSRSSYFLKVSRTSISHTDLSLAW